MCFHFLVSVSVAVVLLCLGFIFLFMCILEVWVFYLYFNSIVGSDGFSGGSFLWCAIGKVL